MNFSNRLKEARKKMGYTQKKLAEASGLSTGTIQQYELNKRSPKPEALAKMADALDLGYSYTKEGEPYFYSFVDNVPDPKYEANERFNEKQLLSTTISKKSADRAQQGELLHNFNSVNHAGKSRIVEYSTDIAESSKYQKGEDCE